MKIKQFTLAALVILATGCTKDEPASPVVGENPGRQVTLTASMPMGDVRTRLALAETDEGNISVKWQSGDKISLCFVDNNNVVKTLHDVPVTNIREEGGKSKGDFSFSVPAGITYPYDLYGVYGATLATDSRTLTFPAVPAVAKNLDDAASMCVMRFEMKNLTVGSPVTVNFSHLGALIGVWLENTDLMYYTLNGLSLTGVDGYNWLYNASGQATYDIVSGTFIDVKAGDKLTYPLGEGNVYIYSGATLKLYRWMVPANTPDLSKKIKISLNGIELPAKAFTPGNYYRLKLYLDDSIWKRPGFPPASDLVAHWPMDGNANDVSGNNHHGTVNDGVTPTTDHKGVSNSAYLFDGTTGSYIDMGSWSNGGAMTFTFWARWDAYNSFSRIVDMGNGSYSNNIAIANHSTVPGKIYYSIFVGSTAYNMSDTGIAVTSQDAWGFYAASVSEAGVMKLYKNGKLIATKNNGKAPSKIIRANQYIGRSNWSVDGYFKGAIDDLRIYNRDLMDGEVMGLYHTTK
ncbi:hypothetical protein EII33_12810 [Bacteroides heparinolyticus]|uniref:Concanavalin A-like lectin/glucanase superfamily protein n=1 Tax=Prevotella heparinolytica TaxID=28113 RepID=A0A3P2A2M5_9BACE|nr:LamG domain-containing protein [Bacteroides heparinolyticus]RRD87883.1 hypothetical protein EII33_12810 [Bacteroides heparinolyticus]